jgi:two-component system CheB/CheR fusion protein
MLVIHSSALGEDLIHLAHRELAEPLRDAIDAALNGERSQRVHELSSLPDRPGERRYFEIYSFPIHAQTEPAKADDLVAVLISDVTDREQRAADQNRALAAAEERARRLQELLDESTRSVRELRAANQELTIADARLRSTNEELLVGSEESEAAMEEIETLNEEQQATNEELETLNEELQATVEELNATYEDLQTRTLELQEQSVYFAPWSKLEEQTRRLEAVLNGMTDAVMVVDGSGTLVLTNPAFRAVFGEALPTLEDDAGKPLRPDADPVQRAARGETFTQPFSIRQADGSRKWFEARGQPIHQEANGGGAVIIREVSERAQGRLHD